MLESDINNSNSNLGTCPDGWTLTKKENGVNYSLTKETYPIYASPDFQGSSTFAAINYLLSLKDKQIVDDAGTLDIVNTSSKVIKFTFTDCKLSK